MSESNKCFSTFHGYEVKDAQARSDIDTLSLNMSSSISDLNNKDTELQSNIDSLSSSTTKSINDLSTSTTKSINDLSTSTTNSINNLQTSTNTAINNLKNELFNQMNDLHTAKQITLGTSWATDSTNGYVTQSVSVSYITAAHTPTLDVVLSGTKDDMEAQQDERAKILKAETSAGAIKFYATEATTVSLTVSVKIG